MDDLLKQLTGQSGQGSTLEQEAGGLAAGGPAGGGLAGILGAALGGGLGASMGGGMGGLLGGGLGASLPMLLPSLLGMLGGRAGSGTSGMHQLIDGMQAQGMGDVADSWVGTGENQPISPTQVEQALGPDRLAQLSQESGLPAQQVSEGLAAILPGLVNHLTPDGQVPSSEQVQQTVGGLLKGIPAR